MVRKVNHVLRLRGKSVRAPENLGFLRRCVEEHVVPSDIKRRVSKARPKNPVKIEWAFLRDEVCKAVEHRHLIKEEY